MHYFHLSSRSTVRFTNRAADLIAFPAWETSLPNICQQWNIPGYFSKVTGTPSMAAFSTRRIISSNRTSCVSAWTRRGGNPERSAYMGEARGLQGLEPARYVSLMAWRRSGGIQSKSRFRATESPGNSMSTAGDIAMTPPESGSPSSLAYRVNPSASVPPAEIPAGIICPASYPSSTRNRTGNRIKESLQGNGVRVRGGNRLRIRWFLRRGQEQP